MKPPKRDDVVDLEHDGKNVRALVEKVDPDPRLPKFWLVTLVLAWGTHPLRKGDQVTWIESASMAHTVIDIKPHRGGWKVFEGPGVEPFYANQPDALQYATFRATSRRGEIRILDASGSVTETILFDDSGRRR